ncbi:MAG TPA: cation diffusion facilitator family transporter [Sphingomicrobium sp.]|nr:cation diffusion facilitator family transporter [Sphingomicrobium sp.]
MAGHAHPHSHLHPHAHPHPHGPADFSRAFALGIALNVAIVLLEAVFGFMSGSMALIADAGHNLSDGLGLVVGWGGAVMAKRSPSRRFTYGLKKASILAALTNALLLLVAVGAIASESVHRLILGARTDPHTMIWVGAAAIVMNGATALLFARGRASDINVRAAFQHMAADAAVSACVVVAGFLILKTGRQWIDPVMSLIVALVILWGSIGLLKEALGMSLMGVPSGIELDEVEAELARIEGVEAIHDLHIWPLSTTETALTAHLVTTTADYPDALLEQARSVLHARFHIEHCTIQVERHHSAHHDDC